MMQAWRLVAIAALAAAAVPATVGAEDECNPYPVGRCGGFDREVVTFCYRWAGNTMIAATDTHVIALGTTGGVALPENNAKGLAYVRLAPSEAFAADAYEEDLPFETLILETNEVRGAQLAPFKCALFEWWAECDSWMGPYSVLPTNGLYAPDEIAV